MSFADDLKEHDELARKLAGDLAYEYVRVFVGVERWLQATFESGIWQPAEQRSEELINVLAERLQLFCAAFDRESVDDLILHLGTSADNLGCGDRLDVGDHPAFRAPAERRMFGPDDTPLELPDDVAAVRAELLRRRIVVLGVEQYGGQRTVVVSGPSEVRAEDACAELLPGLNVLWLGLSPRRIVPARCTAWRDKGGGQVRVYVLLDEASHIDELIAVEEDDRIVVHAFACTPTIGPGTRRHEDFGSFYVDGEELGDRMVIDGYTGEPIPSC